jgi:cytochrome c oxidase subunit 2
VHDSRTRRLWRRGVPLLGAVLLTSGCQIPVFGYPTHIASQQADRIQHFWQWTCVAALAVGLFTLVLILWPAAVSRRRNDDIPPQVRYNLPIEILYTVVPFVIVAVLFYFTIDNQDYLDKQLSPAAFEQAQGVNVDVTGFQWNWTFAYPDEKTDAGQEVSVTGSQQQEAVMILPEGRPIRFHIMAADVIHAFWVPAFLYKRDAIPGRDQSYFEVTPNRVGTYVGHCAELCGIYHDRMNFIVKVLPPAQYDTEMAAMQTKGASS